MGPLSLKQHRENLKHQGQQRREDIKMDRDESRKEELHEIKLEEARAKAGQGLNHKEQLHEVKMSGSPLGAKTHQKELAHPVAKSDTIPAMLTPGEAVIPKSAAQNPDNKEIIQRLVAEGRGEGYANGVSSVGSAELGSHARQDTPYTAFANGTTSVPTLKDVRTVNRTNAPPQPGYALGSTDVGGWDDDTPNSYSGLSGWNDDTPNSYSGLGDPSFVAQTGQWDDYNKRTFGAESGGDDYAKNKLSSASGRAQFVKDTWNGLRQNNPSSSYANVEFGSPEFYNASNQTAALNDYNNEAAASLSKAKIPTSNANMYGAHRLGVPDFTKVMSTDPSTPLAQILPGRVMAANPDLKNMTVADFQASNAKKMAQNAGKSVPTMDQAATSLSVPDMDAMGNPTGTYSQIDQPVPKPRMETVTQQKQASGAPTPPPQFDAEGRLIKFSDDLKKVPVMGWDDNTRLDPNVGIPKLPSNPVSDEEVPPASPESTVTVSPQERDSILSSFAQQSAPAIEAAKEQAKDLPPEEQKTFMQSFLSNLFGKTGLFNAKDLTRFAVIGAGGMLTGGSVGGSLRYAAKDTLQQVDARDKEQALEARATKAQDASERKVMINNLMGQGYSAEGITKFLDSGGKDSTLLGPRTTQRKPTGDTKRMVVTEEGPLKGKEIVLTKENVVSGKNKDGTEWTYNGHVFNGETLNGIKVSEYDKTVHSPEAKVQRMADLNKDIRETAKDHFDQEYGGELIKGQSNPKLQGLPTLSKIEQQTAAFMKARDFDPTDASLRNSMKGVAQVALEDMTLSHKASGGKVVSFEPFLAKAMLVGKSGVPSTAFDLGTGKPMNPGKIVDLENALKGAVIKTDKPVNGSDLEQKKNVKLKAMYETYNSNKALQQKYSNEGDAETGFYRYVMGNLK